MWNHGVIVLLLLFILKVISQCRPVDASMTMKRLYEELFTDYNRLIIPIAPNKTRVTVTLGLKLGQILDLNLKQQILSTNLWVEQTWHDHRLEWNPQLFGGIDMIHVPAENLWIPDIVLFNNADGNYELTLVAKAVLYSNGTVVWKPPTQFRSTCEIDVEYFPFDIQTCFLRFGSWTYAGDEVDIRHVSQKKRKVDIGIDLSQFYKNVEWDIIDVPAYYNENYDEGTQESYPDITFKIVIRRKMLFYLVNLILPVALMTFMTVSVFYLPADSNEKVTLSISILTSLIVFFLLMLEVIPPTSLAVPLFGKYLLFTLVLVSLSACVSVYVLNIYHRAPSVHQMSPRMRQLFLKTLPRLLRLDRPDPRERSSLNRFRKKKIAQQILQARQHNKVYDLAQPLAASLNLIGTLHKSYEINPKDDDLKGKKHCGGDISFMSEDDEEGRYFRKYVDNYIEQLEVREANHRNSFVRSHERSNRGQSTTLGSNQHKCAVCSKAVAGQQEPSRRAQVCYEHQRCCRNANQPYPTYAGQAHNGAECCNNQQQQQQQQQQQLDWTTESSDMMRPLVSTDRHNTMNSCKNCLHKSSSNLAAIRHQAPFGILNDDTLDMTFDYEDQDEAGFITPSGRHSRSKSGTNPIDDLPSPPPPPRQLAQLSDSMRDLSGRISSCSQQRLVGGGAVAASSSGGGLAANGDASHQLVDKLISSINLINIASDEMDATTSTSTTSAGIMQQQPANRLQNYQLDPSRTPASLVHRQRMAATISPMAFDSSFEMDTTTGRQSTKAQPEPGNQCTCDCAMNENSNNNLSTGCSCLPRPRMCSNQQHHMCQQQRGSPSNHESKREQAPESARPSEILLSLRLPYDRMPAHVRAAIRSILFIADTIKNEDDENSAIEDWESVSMVVDRLFLWIFFILCTFGSLIILALAPSLYDQRDSIDDKLRIEIPPSNCTALN